MMMIEVVEVVAVERVEDLFEPTAGCPRSLFSNPSCICDVVNWMLTEDVAVVTAD
jgi:hypothetical protein